MPPSSAPETRTPEQVVDEKLEKVRDYDGGQTEADVDAVLLPLENKQSLEKAKASLVAYIQTKSIPVAYRKANLDELRTAALKDVQTYFSGLEEVARGVRNLYAALPKRISNAMFLDLGLSGEATLKNRILSVLSGQAMHDIETELNNLSVAHQTLVLQELRDAELEAEFDIPALSVGKEIARTELKLAFTAHGRALHFAIKSEVRTALLALEAQKEGALRKGRAVLGIKNVVGPALDKFFEGPLTINGEQGDLLRAMAHAAMDSMETPPSNRDEIVLKLGSPAEFSSRRLFELARIEDALDEYARVAKLSTQAKERKVQLEMQKKELMLLLAREYIVHLSKVFRQAIRNELPDEAITAATGYFEGEANAQINIKRDNDFGGLVKFRFSNLLARLSQGFRKTETPKVPSKPWSRRAKVAAVIGAGLAAGGTYVGYAYTLGGKDPSADLAMLQAMGGDFVEMIPDFPAAADVEAEPASEEVPVQAEAPVPTEVVAAPVTVPVGSNPWGRLGEVPYPSKESHGTDTAWLLSVAAARGVTDPYSLSAIAIHCEGGVNQENATVNAQEFSFPTTVDLGPVPQIPWEVPGVQVRGFKALSTSVEDACKAVVDGNLAMVLEPL